jgi:hypothetical protein
MLSHEMFHIWQIKAILDGILPPQLTRLWQDEFVNYQSPLISIKEHWNQNIEKAAAIFSNKILEHLTGYSLKLKPQFEEKDVKLIESLNFTL